MEYTDRQWNTQVHEERFRYLVRCIDTYRKREYQMKCSNKNYINNWNLINYMYVIEYEHRFNFNITGKSI